MFLRDYKTKGLIEVMDMKQVFDPFLSQIHGRTQAGEDTMDEGDFDKNQLAFPSGEPLPRCWMDSHYRQH